MQAEGAQQLKKNDTAFPTLDHLRNEYSFNPLTRLLTG